MLPSLRLVAYFVLIASTVSPTESRPSTGSPQTLLNEGPPPGTSAELRSQGQRANCVVPFGVNCKCATDIVAGDESEDLLKGEEIGAETRKDHPRLIASSSQWLRTPLSDFSLKKILSDDSFGMRLLSPSSTSLPQLLSSDSSSLRRLFSADSSWNRLLSSVSPWLQRLLLSDSPWKQLLSSVSSWVRRLLSPPDSPWTRLLPPDSSWLRRLLSSDAPGQLLLRALDRAILADSVRLADGVFLVKDVHDEEGTGHTQTFPFGLSTTAPPTDERGAIEVAGDEDRGLFERLLRRTIVLLETHAIRVRMGMMAARAAPSAAVGGRVGGHGYRHAFPLMVGSFALLSAFFVPLGFQFLAVVAGKALVLSQIAVMIALAGRFWGVRGSGHAAQTEHAHPASAYGLGLEPFWQRDDARPLAPSTLRAYLERAEGGSSDVADR